MLRSLKYKNHICTCLPYGEQWFRISLPKNVVGSLSSFGQKIYESDVSQIKNIIATEAEICIQTYAIESVLESIRKIDIEENENDGLTYKLPVCFDEGDDWNIISSFTGLTKKKYIELLLNETYNVDILGFLVGFYYCKSVDTKLQVPRKITPSKRVESGSVAVASDYLGIYSLSSPGGWNVIGNTPIELLDINMDPPTFLKVGDRIRIESINSTLYKRIKNQRLNILQYNERY